MTSPDCLSNAMYFLGFFANLDDAYIFSILLLDKDSDNLLKKVDKQKTYDSILK